MAKMTAGSLCPVCQEKYPDSEYRVSEIQSDITKTVFWCRNCNTQFNVASDIAEAAPVVAITAGVAGLLALIGKALDDNNKKA